MKTQLKIEAKVSSFEEGKELLEKLEVLQKEFEVNITFVVDTTSRLFQVIPE